MPADGEGFCIVEIDTGYTAMKRLKKPRTIVAPRRGSTVEKVETRQRNDDVQDMMLPRQSTVYIYAALS